MLTDAVTILRPDRNFGYSQFRDDLARSFEESRNRAQGIRDFKSALQDEIRL